MMKTICISRKSGPDQESENAMCSWCCGLDFILDNYRKVIKRKADHRVYLDLHFRNWTRFSIIYSATESFSQCCWETNSSSPPLLPLLFFLKRKREREKWRRGRERALVFPLGLNLFSNSKGQTCPQKLEMKTIFK